MDHTDATSRSSLLNDKEHLIAFIHEAHQMRANAGAVPNSHHFVRTMMNRGGGGQMEESLLFLSRIPPQTPETNGGCGATTTGPMRSNGNRTGLFSVTLFPSSYSPSPAAAAAQQQQPAPSIEEQPIKLPQQLVLASLTPSSLVSEQKNHSSVDENLTKEEQLRMERLRSVSKGITDYALDEQSRQVLLPAGKHLFLYNLEDRLLNEIPSSFSDVAKMDAKLSPGGEFVSFVARGDIFVTHLPTGIERQVTFSAQVAAAATAANSPPPYHDAQQHVLAMDNSAESEHCGVTSGVAEFIMQEEFGRFTGYWWSPSKNENGEFLICYLEVDERAVPTALIGSAGEAFSVDEYRYPRPGEHNAASTLCFARIKFSPSEREIKISTKRLPCWFENNFPWAEYVPRVGFTNRGQRVWLQLLDRRQQRSCLVIVDPETISFTVVRDETSPTWINISDLIYFWKDGSETFIIDSENTSPKGYRRLYLYSSDQNNGKWELVKDFIGTTSLASSLIVDKESLFVNESEGRIFFLANREENPLECHLYSASIADDKIHQITPDGFYFSNFSFSYDFSKFSAVFSNVRCSSPRMSIFQRTSVDPIRFSMKFEVEFPFTSFMPENFPITVPTFVSFQNKTGHTIHGAVFVPSNARQDNLANKKRPTMLFVYGGPHVQLVRNSTLLLFDGRLQMLVRLGIVVCIFDSRGSARRGRGFEEPLRCCMGQVEVGDQVQGLEYLMREHPEIGIDPKRIGVFGWSYGGYLSLQAIGQRPDFFRLAIAGAPVTKWELYDSGYTERYMDLPSNNSIGYALGSVLHHISNFPEEENRLLIVHGLIDENVHFKHTEVLIDELIEHCKPYKLLVYPHERHGIRSLQSTIHFQWNLIMFIVKNL